jgi:UDP-2,3-diacylglucosamine pyrophosphatase LpxH
MPGLAAVSDLHLGAPTSYFVADSVRSRFFETLKGLSPDGLDLIILVGDILDLAVGTAPEPWVLAREFFSELAQKVLFSRLVYIPGNHDHHVWVMLAEHEELLSKLSTVVRPAPGKRNAMFEVGTIYPSWTPLHDMFPIDVQHKVCFAYPFLMQNNGSTRFIFHHGHYFDPVITPLADYAGGHYLDWQKVEAFNLPYIESLFSLCSWDPVVQTVELGFYDRLTGLGTMKPVSAARRAANWLAKRCGKKKVGGCDIGRIDKMMGWAGFKKANLTTNDVWVFGHTHCKGKYSPKQAPKALQIFNLGGWVLNHDPGAEGAWSTPGILYAGRDGECTYSDFCLTPREEQSILAKRLVLARSRPALNSPS